MKRILAILLSVIMVMSLAACGNKADKDTIDPTGYLDPDGNTIVDTGTEPSDENLNNETKDKYVVDENGKLTNIRKNGKLPSNAKDLTDEETYYYLGEVIQAVIDLDIEKLKTYSDDENVLVYFESIANDESHKAMYDKTVGNIIYLKDSHYFVFKDPFYIYSRWYSDQKLANGKTIVAQLTTEEIDDVYAKYYDDAPYIVDNANEYRFDFTLIDGSIYFNLDNVLDIVGYKSIGDLTPDAPFNYGNYVFGNNRDSVVDTSAQDKPASREILDIIASCDLDKMVEYVENNKNYDLNFANKEAVYDDCYQLYYKNELLRKKIQAWMNDNTETYKSDFGVVTYVKADIDHKDNWPFNMLTEAERDQIRSLPIYVKFATYEIGEMAEWGQYYIIVEQMIYDGAIEHLYHD